MSYLNEAFKELDELEDDVDLQSEEDVKKALDFMKGDIDNTDHLEMVVDIDAETEDDLQDSYVGEILLMCPACHTLHYAHEEDIVTSEDEPDFVNVGEPCPHCKQENGFEIKGKVAEYVPEGEEPKEEEKDDFDEMDIDAIEDEETEEEKAQFEESFKLRKKYVKEVAEDNLDDLARFTGIELPTTKRVTESKAKTLKENLTEAPLYDLKPQYDARQSFYNKATVDTGDKGDKNKLYSYHTLVAEMKDGKPVVYGTYSQTTLRHIKEWLKQNGFKAENSKQIMADYGAKRESCKEAVETSLLDMFKDSYTTEHKIDDEHTLFLEGLTENNEGCDAVYDKFDKANIKGVLVEVVDSDGEAIESLGSFPVNTKLDEVIVTAKENLKESKLDDIDAQADNKKEVAKQESCNESTLDERNLTTAERQNKMMNDIFANFNKQADEMAKFLLDKGLTQEEVNDLKAHTGLGKHALGDKIEELGLHDEFFGKKESCKESTLEEVSNSIKPVGTTKTKDGDELDLFASYKEANSYLEQEAKKNKYEEFEIFEDDYEVPNGLMLVSYWDADHENEKERILVAYKDSVGESVTKRDDIDAQADNKKEVAKQEFEKKIDDADADRDDKLKESKLEITESAHKIIVNDDKITIDEDTYDLLDSNDTYYLFQDKDGVQQEIRKDGKFDSEYYFGDDELEEACKTKEVKEEAKVEEATKKAPEITEEQKACKDEECKKKELDESLLVTADFNDYEPWSGAVSTYERIEEEGKLDALENLLEDCYPEGISMVGINDILWFEPDWVFEMLGITDEEEEDEDEEEVVEEDEFEESLFENLVNRYCTRVYENVDNYKATACSREDGKFIIEGMLTYKNGKQEPTKFTFTEGKSTKNIKKYIGLNETFSNYKKAFTLNMTKDGNKLLSESLYYNYNAKVEDKNYPIKGKVATPKTK